jgi:hypothetical protein
VYIVFNAGFTDGATWDPTTDSVVGADRKTHTVAGLFYTRGNGQNWTTPNDIALIHVSAALRSSIAANPDGRLNLLYKGLGPVLPAELDVPGGNGPGDIWYTNADGDRAESFTSWSPRHRLTRGTEGYYSEIAVDRQGIVHAMWTESGGGMFGAYYSNSADGGLTWSKRVALEDTRHVLLAHLKVDDQDRVGVVLEVRDPRNKDSSGTLVYTQSSDSGTSWITTDVQFPVDPTNARNVGKSTEQPGIGIDGNGSILLVFRNDATKRVLYSRSVDGKSWSNPQPLPGIREGVVRPFDVYDMVTDNLGHIHLAMVGYSDNSDEMALFHTEWDGVRWLQLEVIARSPRFPEYPRLTVGPGNKLHVAWFAGDRPTVDRRPVGVWYSSRTIAASAEPRGGRAVPYAGTPRPSIVAPQGAALDPLSNAYQTPSAVSPSSTIDTGAGGRGWFATVLSEPAFPVGIAGLCIVLVVTLLFTAKLSLLSRKSRSR